MYKKILTAISILIICIFTFSVCLATDNNIMQDAANGVKDAVGGAENAIEDGAKGISNTAKNVTGGAENAVSNMGKSTTSNNNSYVATRTATDTTGSTFMGMNATAWTWLIIGIATIAIVALVWYYGKQVSSYNDHME